MLLGVSIKRILIYPDAQIPYHNPRQVRSLHSYIAATKPDSVVIIGDFMDYPAPSRWSKGTAEEYQGSVLKDSETGKRVLGDLRRGYDGPIYFVEGNHDARPRQYLAKYAPALAESTAFNIDTLLDFNSHGVELAPDFFDLAPGWVATHGHLGISLSQIPGKTALNAVRALGKSVVIGHVHRLALCPDATGYTGRLTTKWGMEVGHVMDIRKASYLKRGAANWQSGFGMLYVEGKFVKPEVIPIEPNGMFVADGKVWR